LCVFQHPSPTVPSALSLHDALPIFAILSHSVRMLPREFEDELRRQGIPYLTSGGSGFFDRQEIKDVLGLLRMTENPMDDGALVRSEEHTSEPSHQIISYAVFCLKKKRSRVVVLGTYSESELDSARPFTIAAYRLLRRPLEQRLSLGRLTDRQREQIGHVLGGSALT